MVKIEALAVTQGELNCLPYSTNEIIGEEYSQIIIIPTEDIHDSEYRCMKYVLLKFKEYSLVVVGVVGGYSDVIHLPKDVTRINIDCLPCGYLRVMFDEPQRVPSFIGSDFFVDKWEWGEKDEAD